MAKSSLVVGDCPPGENKQKKPTMSPVNHPRKKVVKTEAEDKG